MARGGTFLLLGGSLAAVGCTMDQNVHVRPIADTQAKMRFSGGLLNQARGQLALGNVGLALESFRTLQREQPESADAFAGIAACYAAMGRYDLARANYEFALAYAPQDPRLLTALANSLAQLGEHEQAAQVRMEAARIASSAPAPRAEASAVAPAGVPRVGSITLKLPEPAKAVATPEEQPAQIAAPRLGPALFNASAVTIGSPHGGALEAIPKSGILELPKTSTVVATQEEQLTQIAAPRLGPAMLTASASPIRSPRGAALEEMAKTVVFETTGITATALPLQSSVLAPTAAGAAVHQTIPAKAIQPPALSRGTPTVADGPRLERQSRSEVVLVTVRQRPQFAQLDKKAATGQLIASAAPARAPIAPSEPSRRPVLATMVQWVPLRFAPGAQNIQLLNAARSQGLAGKTRTALVNRGWRKIGIGNAREVRQRSLVLYAPSRGNIARRLAAQFRCKAVKVAGLRTVVVLLGRDALSRRSTVTRA